MGTGDLGVERTGDAVLSANDELFDASLRHAIGIRRLSSGEVARIIALLNKSQTELEGKLVTQEARAIYRSGSFTTKRYKALLEDIVALRKSVFREILQSNRKELIDLAFAEQDFGKRTLQAVVPVQFDYAVAAPELLRSIVTTQPFAGGTNAAKTLGQWWEDLATADKKRINDAISLGMVQGEGTDTIVARVMHGTELSKKNAEAIVRTGINHVSNNAREALFAANNDILRFLEWMSTLDGRTTLICSSRDGHFAPLGNTPLEEVPAPQLNPPYARPPAHMSCWSIMAAALDQDGVVAKMGDRPFVRDTRTRRFRERDFRAEAKEAAGDKWSNWDEAKRRTAITARKKVWASEAIGQVPAKVTYDQWLRRQPTSFQNEVLGVAKGQAFRKGLTLDKFLDNGRTMTLKELGDRYPDFVGVGGD